MANYTITDAPSSGSKYTIGDAPTPRPQNMSLGDVAGSAAANLVPSAMNFAKGVAQPFIHPIDTAESLYKTGVGEVEKMSGVGGDDEKYATAVNHYFSSRYGSVEGFKRAVADDPVGVAGDLSMLATGGGEAAARVPGIVGRAGEVAAKVGDVMNPVGAVGKVVKKIAPAGADVIGHLFTHTGGEAIKQAAQAGAAGHQSAKAFLDHMRGNAPIDEVVHTAKQAVAQMRTARSAAYRAGMKGVAQDKAVLDFTDIDKHIASTDTVKKFKGVDLSPKTADVREEIKTAIDKWKSYDPAEFHTVEGFDALKQQISDIRDHLAYGTPERLIADQAYHAVRETIVKQAPTYAKVMKDYEEASSALNEMQSTLSLKKGVPVDTSARKLLSIMRNNVNTNFGRRAELSKILEQHGAKTLPAQLAGETLRPPWPTSGFGRAEGGIGLAASALTHRPKLLAAMPLMSPRLMGESAYYLGKAGGNPAMQHVPRASLVARALGGTNNAQDVNEQLGQQ